MKIFGLEVVTHKTAVAALASYARLNELYEYYYAAWSKLSEQLEALSKAAVADGKKITELINDRDVLLKEVSEKNGKIADLEANARAMEGAIARGENMVAEYRTERTALKLQLTTARGHFENLEGAIDDRLSPGRKDPKTIKAQSERVHLNQTKLRSTLWQDSKSSKASKTEAPAS